MLVAGDAAAAGAAAAAAAVTAAWVAAGSSRSILDTQQRIKMEINSSWSQQYAFALFVTRWTGINMGS